MENGGKVDGRNKDTLWSLLHTACHAGQHEVVDILVDAGAKLDKEVEGKYNPILLCCSCGSDSMKCPPPSPVHGADIEVPECIECGHVKVSALTRVIDVVHRHQIRNLSLFVAAS